MAVSCVDAAAIGAGVEREGLVAPRRKSLGGVAELEPA